MSSDGLNAPVLERAAAARILVTITVHFNAGRLEYLAEVMRSLAEFPVPVMDIVLVTNTADANEIMLLQRLCDEILPAKSATIRSYEYLGHPHYLTWCHREIIARNFGDEGNGRYTHFIYLEDDIRLSFVNFSYFIEYREKLREAGLIPSFLRVEYNKFLNGFVDSDNKNQIDVSKQPRMACGDVVMVNLPNPYIAFFILDTDLVAEFMRSPSFKRGRSRSVLEMSDMDVRERAAMGLCHENVPEPFECRYVAPISNATGMALNCAWISHLPNNYANDPNSGFGKIRMDALFLNTDRPAPPATKDSIRHTRRSGLYRYLVIPNMILEAIRWRLGFRR